MCLTAKRDASDTSFGVDLTGPLSKQGALEFTAAFRQAVENYKLKHPRHASQMAKFAE